VRQVIDKALPLPSPDALVMPSQRATERTPEIGVEEDSFNTNSSKGMRSYDTNADSEFLGLRVVMVPSFCCFRQCLLDRHIFSSCTSWVKQTFSF
jgi:hypothetical protein